MSHFSVDGTLIESWAAVKSMRRHDGKDEPPGPGRNPTVDWRWEKRTRTSLSSVVRRSVPVRLAILDVVSQRIRKRIEECFGWGKDGRPMRKMKVVGKEKVAFLATLTVGCYTLLRLAHLLSN